MNTPHLTVWINVTSTETGKMSRRKTDAFRAQVHRLVEFQRASGGPKVEDWSLLGNTNLSVDIDLTADGPTRLESLLTAEGLPPFNHYNFFGEDRVDPTIVAAMEAIAQGHGLATDFPLQVKEI